MNSRGKDQERFRARIRAGFCRLLTQGVDLAKTAAIGYCFGDGGARAGQERRALAVISFHGLLAMERLAKTAEVSARILACTGAKDPLVPPTDVTAFQEEIAAADADWQLIIYGKALHSFTNHPWARAPVLDGSGSR